MRQSLYELSCPVHRVVKNTASRSVGNLFLFLYDIFFIDENVQNLWGKKVPVGPFKPIRAVDRKQLFT